MKHDSSLVPMFAALVAAGCGAGAESIPEAAGEPAPPLQAQQAAPAIDGDEIARLRALGPAGLDEILARYDAARGDDRALLERAVDRVAAQRYATHSRLYWYTDLDEAREAARERGVPILSLRMLGRLDQELSCANSRFFRVALYANREVSDYLRKSFVLHWSSERDAPRATIDFGDGRVIETTVAGNSAHYVLDDRGRPVDVVPGLYGPKAFVAALEPARMVALGSRDLDGDARTQALAQFHAAQRQAIQKRYGRVLTDLPAGTALGSAERTTITKAAVEMPVVRTLALGSQVIEASREPTLVWQLARRAPAAKLDASSRALVAELGATDWSAPGETLEGRELEQHIALFESRLAADTVLNQAGYHWLIHNWFVSRAVPSSFEELNRKVYAELFRTPASDPWLGMATRGVFTGLPNDGVAVVR